MVTLKEIFCCCYLIVLCGDNNLLSKLLLYVNCVIKKIGEKGEMEKNICVLVLMSQKELYSR